MDTVFFLFYLESPSPTKTPSGSLRVSPFSLPSLSWYQSLSYSLYLPLCSALSLPMAFSLCKFPNPPPPLFSLHCHQIKWPNVRSRLVFLISSGFCLPGDISTPSRYEQLSAMRTLYTPPSTHTALGLALCFPLLFGDCFIWSSLHIECLGLERWPSS